MERCKLNKIRLRGIFIGTSAILLALIGIYFCYVNNSNLCNANIALLGNAPVLYSQGDVIFSNPMKELYDLGDIAVPFLIEATKSKDQNTMHSSVEILVKMGKQKRIEKNLYFNHLMWRVKYDNHPDVSDALFKDPISWPIAKMIADIGKQFINNIEREFNKSNDLYIKAVLLNALSIMDTSDTKFIIHQLTAKYPEIRCEAIRLITKSSDKKAIPKIMDLFNDQAIVSKIKAVGNNKRNIMVCDYAIEAFARFFFVPLGYGYDGEIFCYACWQPWDFYVPEFKPNERDKWINLFRKFYSKHGKKSVAELVLLSVITDNNLILNIRNTSLASWLSNKEYQEFPLLIAKALEKNKKVKIQKNLILLYRIYVGGENDIKIPQKNMNDDTIRLWIEKMQENHGKK